MVRAKQRARQRRNRITAIVVAATVFLIAAAIALAHSHLAVLEPAGPVAAGERRLMITAFLLMLIVVIPVFAILFVVAWRYRESNVKATYQPNWDHSRLLETVWWLIPSGLISVLALITWRGTYQYDPYKSLALASDTMTVQAVAEPGWWLFLYPAQGVASINELRLPVNTAVKFEITADAPMNSFWIPQLSGQMYAMPGMVTQLNVLASKTGNYYGSSANISGRDFAKMHFQALVRDHKQFDSWVAMAQKSGCMDMDLYNDMTYRQQPVSAVSATRLDPALFGQIVAKYSSMHSMAPQPAVPDVRLCHA